MHAECEAEAFAVEQKAWVEGEMAYQLHADHKLPAQQIAAEVNSRAPARRGIHREVRPRWIQRLIEVHLVFQRPESRVPEATWKVHAMAVDVARIELALRGKRIEKTAPKKLEKLVSTASSLVRDAVREGEPKGDPERWLEEHSRRIRQAAGRTRGVDAPPPSSATTVEATPGHPEQDSLPDGGRRPVFEAAINAVLALLAAQPAPEEVDALLALISRRGEAAA